MPEIATFSLCQLILEILLSGKVREDPQYMGRVDPYSILTLLSAGLVSFRNMGAVRSREPVEYLLSRRELSDHTGVIIVCKGPKEDRSSEWSFGVSSIHQTSTSWVVIHEVYTVMVL